MFGVSFSELLLVGLVALLVLGPERLPGAARTAGLWIGRLKRSFNSIKQEIEREIGADEIRRQLHNEHILSLEQEARKILAPPNQPLMQPLAEPPPNAATGAPVEAAPPGPHVPAPSEDALLPHPAQHSDAPAAHGQPGAHPTPNAAPKPPSPPEVP